MDIWGYTAKDDSIFLHCILSRKPYAALDNDTWINKEALKSMLSPDEFKELNF